MRVSTDMPDDVLVLHDALQKIRDTFGTPNARLANSMVLQRSMLLTPLPPLVGRVGVGLFP